MALDVRSVLPIRKTGFGARCAATTAGDSDEAIDTEGDGGEDCKEEDDDNGYDVVFLHFER